MLGLRIVQGSRSFETRGSRISLLSCKKTRRPKLFYSPVKEGLLPHGAVYTNSFYAKSPN